ncbi:hypothetical protein [Streptomyces tailanensis]|uniref:hypothetical protein n=1 Tax=Streptomyces tailanensis TaxID=2569858 RepID=UPI00122E9DC6|nr:hypothetical protein [Streptomyces tailanensis]
MKTSGISPPDGILVLADILSGKLTARDAAPAVASADRTAGRPAAVAPSRSERRPLPPCRFVVDDMVQGLGL